MVRLSGAAVLLLLVVPLFMYASALFVGIQLGRALERRPDSVDIVSIRGVVEYFAKELWGIERRGREFVGHGRYIEFAEPVVLRPRVGRRSTQPKRVYGRRPGVDLESSNTKIRSHDRNHTYFDGNHTFFDRNHTSPRGVMSVGPWGGSGGHPFYIRGGSAPHLRRIVLYHSAGAIHSLACDYSHAGDDDGLNRTAGPWGLPHSYGSTAVRAVIKLCAGEHVTAVEGTVGRFRDVPGVVITSLTFRSNLGRAFGPYGDRGEGAGTGFSIPVAAGGCIAGFWGRSGWLLDAVGVYIRPSCPSSAGTTQQG